MRKDVIDVMRDYRVSVRTTTIINHNSHALL